ncbi:unnamed protein product [Sphagnum jensenii]|uniref:Uncharacterized protein n=1 Tax=Sphagnum jensenii TaxID=128206 RepID=A0ABP1B7V9_9BRYO
MPNLAVGQILAAESDAIHPNGKILESESDGISMDIILASESDGIPMGRFWQQNQRPFLAAKSDGIPMGKFWYQNQTPSQYFEV